MPYANSHSTNTISSCYGPERASTGNTGSKDSAIDGGGAIEGLDPHKNSRDHIGKRHDRKTASEIGRHNCGKTRAGNNP